MTVEPLQTNAVDVDQVSTAGQVVKEDEHAQVARWRLQMSTQQGRRFLWDEILGRVFLFEHIASDELQALGVRNRGLEFWALSQEHPDLFLQMQTEAMKRAKTEGRDRRARRDRREEQTTV